MNSSEVNHANNDHVLDSHDLYSIGPPVVEETPPEAEELELTLAAVDAAKRGWRVFPLHGIVENESWRLSMRLQRREQVLETRQASPY